MTILSDVDILQAMQEDRIICEPFVPKNLSVSSIDLRLGNKLIVHKRSEYQSPDWYEIGGEQPRWDWNIDCNGKLTVVPIGIKSTIRDLRHEPFILQPGSFVLGVTMEKVGPKALDLKGALSDKSTLARVGLSTHWSAGYIDPGNVLNITLELKNQGCFPIVLYAGMHICQIEFQQLLTPSSAGYSGKYMGDNTVQSAK